MAIPINSDYDLLSPEAWNALLLANDFPMRPALVNANTNIAGVDIAGQVASKNKTVKIPKAVKPEGDANVYNGTYTDRKLKFTQDELIMEDVLEDSFVIDKYNEMFALPDFISSHVVPGMNQIMDTINKNYVKRELNKFSTAVVDLNTDPTVLSPTDLRFVRKTLLKRHFVEDKTMAAVIDPDGWFDLTGYEQFTDADRSGSAQTLLTGALTNKFGFDFMTDNIGADVDSEDAVGNAAVAANAAIGDKTVTIDDGAGGASNTTLSNGDRIYFGTDNGKDDWYVVDSVNEVKTEITLKEPLRKAVSDNADITGVAGSAQYFYDPDSIAVVTALPSGSRTVNSAGVTRIPFFEPNNRVNFMISIEGDRAGAKVSIETVIGARNFYETRGGIYVRGDANKA